MNNKTYAVFLIEELGNNKHELWDGPHNNINIAHWEYNSVCYHNKFTPHLKRVFTIEEMSDNQ